MSSIPKKRSLADMQHRPSASVPEDFNDADYAREVLQLDGVTEAAMDDAILREATTLGIDLSSLGGGGPNNGHISICDSDATAGSGHVRSSSTNSGASASTGLTSTPSTNEPLTVGAPSISKKRSSVRRPLSFSEYDKYLAQVAMQHQPGLDTLAHVVPSEPAPSVFSISTRKSYNGLKNGIKRRLGLRRKTALDLDPKFCVCCRDEFKVNKTLNRLPCSHEYCDKCLRILLKQASAEESKMPPKCCGKPVPGATIKSVLSREEQYLFMHSVLIFSTPWNARMFCPNPSCSEFIPLTAKLNPKQPFEATCPQCRTRACQICKRVAHPPGHDCPSDTGLDAVLRLGEHHGWRRCYKCRTLVELTQGCTHITCTCKAEFCYICGAVWDAMIGCPNYCDGEDELIRRREAATLAASVLAAAQAELSARRRAATQHPAFRAFRARQLRERSCFQACERKQKWAMWTRHGQQKLDVLDRFEDLRAKMLERHAKTATHLEDRQVAAEMELRSSLKQSERSVNIRLRHMEAYCAGSVVGGAGAGPAGYTVRTVTDRDRRLLAQQLSLRDDLARLHQARINVLREKQAKQMEQLLERQAAEVLKLERTREAEVEALEEGFVGEEERWRGVWLERQARLIGRWRLLGMLGAWKVGEVEGWEGEGWGVIDWGAGEGEGEGEGGAGGEEEEEEEEKVDRDEDRSISLTTTLLS